MSDVLRWLLEHMVVIVLVWLVLAVVAGLFVGRFIRVGKGPVR